MKEVTKTTVKKGGKKVTAVKVKPMSKGGKSSC